MPKYKATKKENGKYKIERVPVFKLGNTRGFEYSVGWGKQMLQVMGSRAKAGYYPPIIIGHVDAWIQGEQPANGFMSNFSLGSTSEDPTSLSGTVYCDFDDVPEATMELIRDMKYPYRSIEVRNTSFEITAVALLGSSEPHFKFPRLEITGFSAGDQADTFGYMGDADLLMPIETEDGTVIGKNKGFVREIVDGIRDLFRKDEAPRFGGDEDKSVVEDDMDREKFKEQFGFYPEEISGLQAKAAETDKYKAQVDELQGELVKLKAAEFDKYCQEHGVAPASTSRFQALISGSADPDKAREEFKAIIKEGFKAPLGETSQHADKPNSVDGTDAEALHSAVTAYAAEHKLSYQDALEKVLAGLDKKGGAQ